MKKINLSKDINSGDYNPFYTGDNNIFDKPLTTEEMKELGFTRGEFKMDDNGYHAWVYYKDICSCSRIGCISTKTNFDNGTNPKN